MIINHNLSAMSANRNSKVNQGNLTHTMNRMASGLRITRAGDDAAGLAISEKMRAQIRGLTQASRNAADGVSFIQTTEGFLQATTDALQRMRELAVQAANGINSAEDRIMIQVEISQLVAEVDRIANHAQFNGMNMLTGDFSTDSGMNIPAASMWLHIGANMDQRTRIYIGTMTAEALGLSDIGTSQILTVETPDQANSAIGILDLALNKVNKQRADLGAYQNRMEMAIRSIDIGAENLQASESRIRDLDMASESVRLATNQVLGQAAVAMLAQANAQAQSVLQLLG
ncbi:MAG: flagellin [Spirochaetaceae bacterium]|nr:flagellin [Spirochaetaceae bacterium]